MAEFQQTQKFYHRMGNSNPEENAKIRDTVTHPLPSPLCYIVIYTETNAAVSTLTAEKMIERENLNCRSSHRSCNQDYHSHGNHYHGDDPWNGIETITIEIVFDWMLTIFPHMFI